MEVEINNKIYHIERFNFSYDVKSINILICEEDIETFVGWMIRKKLPKTINLPVNFDSGVWNSELKNCHIIDISGVGVKPNYNVEIAYSEHIKINKPEVEINGMLYSIVDEKYDEVNEQKSIVIEVAETNIHHFAEIFKTNKIGDLNLFDSDKNYAKLSKCYLIEIIGKKLTNGFNFIIEIGYKNFTEVIQPEKINIELHSIQVPENKNLIRTEMEKGVLFTYEDKIPPTKKVLENDYNNEYWRKEIVKCREDIVYFIEKYLTIIDPKTYNKIPFILTENQKFILRNWDNYNINVIETYRQGGLSTLYAAKTTHDLLFEDNVKVAYCGCKCDLNIRFIKLISEFMTEVTNQLPFYGLQYIKNNKDEILLNNGNHFKTIRIDKNCLLPQYLVKEATDLIVDDAAFNGLTIGILEELHDRNKGLRTIISSVKYLEPNNFNQIINSRCKTYLKLNIFKIYWHDDERFNQDLKWYHINYIEEIYGEKVIKTAYIPGNEWYSHMCQIMGKTVEFEIGVGFNPHKTNKEGNNNNNNNNINMKWLWV